MLKIKTFQFLISNYVGNKEFNKTNCSKGEYEDHRNPKYSYGRIKDEEDIDIEINKFISNKKVISIQTDTYTIHRHNNAYCDSVIARYTITYEEA